MKIQLRYSLVLLFSLTLTLLHSTAGFADDAATRSKQVFHLCAACHGPAGQGNHEIGAPAIAGLPEWYIMAQLKKFREGVRGLHPKDLAGMRMRPMSKTITEDDVTLMAKYVAALPRLKPAETVQGSMVKGEARFVVCVACHGAKGEGNQALNAPPLNGSSDWYLVTQLKNFKGGVRGANPQTDPNGATMAGIAAALDDAAIKDVVSYINVLSTAPVTPDKPTR